MTDGHFVGTTFIPGVHGLGGSQYFCDLCLRQVVVLTQTAQLFLKCPHLYTPILVYAEKRYNEAVECHKKECAKQRANRESKPRWRENAQQWKNQENDLIRKLREAKALRNRVYSVNIIPARYRNIHAAYYLYDFFSTCRETDLEKTIQTMLLDEIIQKMDELIRQNQEIILNQRMQMAMQERQNRDIAENHRQEMKRLASMERNQELQMDYQNMIARNQEVTNFFLAADYLRKR